MPDVAPGSLIDQWQEKLYDKFGLRFELLTRSMIDATLDVFDQYALLIARMDQLSRAGDLLERLQRSDWDLVVVDEAHRMSAHYFGAAALRCRWPIWWVRAVAHPWQPGVDDTQR